MKTVIAGFTLTLIVLGLDATRGEAADEHAMHEVHAAHAALAAPEGRLWPTDEPLRAAMLKIRTAVEHATPAYERKKLQPVDAQALAATVEESVAYMIANCRLAPEPDAALHVLIGRMMGAAAALKNDPSSDEGVPQLIAVMKDYRSTFDHPG